MGPAAEAETRQTELMERHPMQAVRAWLGNSEKVAMWAPCRVYVVTQPLLAQTPGAGRVPHRRTTPRTRGSRDAGVGAYAQPRLNRGSRSINRTSAG